MYFKFILILDIYNSTILRCSDFYKKQWLHFLCCLDEKLLITDIINIHEFINETLLFYIYTFNPFQLFMCCLINLQAEGLLNEVGLFIM